MAGKENESNRLFEDEKVIEIEIERLRSFKDHPFKVTDDKENASPEGQHKTVRCIESADRKAGAGWSI